jgi:hypothetical protein
MKSSSGFGSHELGHTRLYPVSADATLPDSMAYLPSAVSD